MSHDDLDTIEVLDEEDFQDQSQLDSIEDSENITVSPAPRYGTRRLIEDVLEDQRLRATLNALDECFSANESASAD